MDRVGFLDSIVLVAGAWADAQASLKATGRAGGQGFAP